MAGKARVHELAKELGVSSKEILAALQEMGEFVKSASSTIEPAVARRVRETFAKGNPRRKMYRALLDRRYKEASSHLARLKSSDPGMHDHLWQEIGHLLELYEAHKAHLAWLTGLWVALATTDQHRPGRETRTADLPQHPHKGNPNVATSQFLQPTQNRQDATLRPRPEEIGQQLELAFLQLLRQLFSLQGDTANSILTRLRQQRPGLQFGHDIEFDTSDLSGKARCHVECKNYAKPITLEHVAAKILQTEFHWKTTPLDHLIIVSPHQDASNELSIMLQGWNESHRFPFRVQIWSPERGIKDLFRLAPELYQEIYREPAHTLTDTEKADLLKRWKQMVRPVARIPTSWLSYLRTPALHQVYGEDAHFEDVRADPIDLQALSESGTPVPGTLDSAVREWLRDPNAERSLLLLAEFGDGKSFFGYRLGIELGEQFLSQPTDGWVTLRVPLRQLRESASPADLLAKRLAEIGSNVAEWRTITQSYHTLVILDGFDEISSRIDPETLKSNMKLLGGCIKSLPGSRIIVTSRTHFFDHIQDYQSFLDHIGQPRILRIAPVPRERRLDYLLQYARRIGAEEKLQQLKRLYDPIGLAAKPLFLQMIKATLPSLPSDHFNEVVLYRQYILDSLEKKLDDLLPESQSDRRSIVRNLHEILEELAVALHTSQLDYVHLREFSVRQSHNLAKCLWHMYDSADSSAAPGSDEIDGRDARSRIGVRSLLKPVRGVDQTAWPVDFFHRSMREYFVARAITRSVAEHDKRAVDLLSKVPLQPEIVNFAVLLMRQDPEEAEGGSDPGYALKLESLARSATIALYGEQSLGGNAITLLYSLTGNLPQKNWAGLALDYAYLAGADLDYMSFRGSSLRYANLDNTSLVGTDFRDAELTGVQLEETAPVVALTLDADNNTVYAAYGDHSIRRWIVGAGGRASSSTVANLDFRSVSLDLSAQKDLIVSGAHHVSILAPSSANDSWEVISSFDLAREIKSFSIAETMIAIQRSLADGHSQLELYDPASRQHAVLIESRDGSPSYCIVDPQTAFTYSPSGGLSLHVSIGTTTHAEFHVPMHRTTAIDSRRIDNSEILLVAGSEAGEVVLWKVTTKPDIQFSEVWRISNAHSSSVTAVRISGGLIVSGGMDRTMCLFPLMDQWQAGSPMRLHRTLNCMGTLVEGLRGHRERALLDNLIRSSEQPTSATAAWTPADLANYLSSRRR